MQQAEQANALGAMTINVIPVRVYWSQGDRVALHRTAEDIANEVQPWRTVHHSSVRQELKLEHISILAGKFVVSEMSRLQNETSGSRWIPPLACGGVIHTGRAVPMLMQITSPSGGDIVWIKMQLKCFAEQLIGQFNAAFSDVLHLRRSEVDKVRIGPHAQCCGCGGLLCFRTNKSQNDFSRTLLLSLSRLRATAPNDARANPRKGDVIRTRARTMRTGCCSRPTHQLLHSEAK
ncbi:hypothetical protein KC337_g75 [Hortaea werneckii]|nr:hypothetical protein KC337_g75 [Hortaea werneckii]